MAQKIYIGNLSYSTDESVLKNEFSAFGEVVAVNIIMDKITNQSKGFGFVEMAEEADAKKAISNLNGKNIDGRRVRVNMAEEKPARSKNGFGNSYKNNLPKTNFNQKSGENYKY